jgi:chemotaxis protein methyltransferase CheR
MTPDEFAYAADLIRTRTGFVLTRDKAYIVESRLGPVVRHHRLKTVGELIGAMREGREDLAAEVLDAMMTKDTGFFRDWKPFVHLREETLRDLADAHESDGEQHLRILCAGVSTGQEAYSVALTAIESGRFMSDWRVDILGIDLSAASLAIATKGAYTQFEVQRGLPVHVLANHFTKDEEHWVLEEAVRDMVEFKACNLLDDLAPLGKFDVILCRNVLAYFDLSSKAEVLAKLAGAMARDGRLYLGAAETPAGVVDDFRAVDAGLSVFALA